MITPSLEIVICLSNINLQVKYPATISVYQSVPYRSIHSQKSEMIFGEIIITISSVSRQMATGLPSCSVEFNQTKR